MRLNVGVNFANAEFFRPNRSLPDVVLVQSDRATPSDGGVFLRDGINIETTRYRLLCHDLQCGAEFFGDDLASYRISSISCRLWLRFTSQRCPSTYTLTDRVSIKVMQSALSIRPLVSTLSFEPTDLLHMYGS